MVALSFLFAPPVCPQTCTVREQQKLIASDASASDQLGNSVSVSGNRAVVGAWGASFAGSSSGAAYVFRLDDNGTPLYTMDDFWVEEQKLGPSNPSGGDLFGWSVSIHKDRAIAGARFHRTSIRSGAAYIFRRDDNDTPEDSTDDRWIEEDMLTASDAAAGDDFGTAVAISGRLAIVGAPDVDDACIGKPDPVCDSGAAYVYQRNDNDTPLDDTDDFWEEIAKLTADDAAAGDGFGFSVAMYGDRAVVGSWRSSQSGLNAGSAYVFRKDDGGTVSDPSDDTWWQEARLIASDAAPRDNFGIAVGISYDRAVVGSWMDDDAGNLSGSAYVFRRGDAGTPLDPSDDFWFEEAKLIASDAAAGDELGKSVSIDGDRIALGAFEDDDACMLNPDPDPNCDSGSAYVFRLDDNGTPSQSGDDIWIEQQKLTASDTSAGDFFGRVSISGDYVFAGSLDDDAGERAGALYVFSATTVCYTLVDYAQFHSCLTGVAGGLLPECSLFDLDGDTDIDLRDFSLFLATFVGM